MANKYQIQATKPNILIIYDIVADNRDDAVRQAKEALQKDIASGKFETAIELDIIDEKELKPNA